MHEIGETLTFKLIFITSKGHAYYSETIGGLMLDSHALTKSLRVFVILFLGGFLSACNYLNNLLESATTTESKKQPVVLNFAVASHVAWMPWFLANEERIFQQYTNTYGVNIQFVTDEYRETINKYVAQEVDAVAITNIDAIAQLVRQSIDTDAILITSYSNGNEAILVSSQADTNALKFRGKTFALLKFSARHYLLDRYLIRGQIPFDDVQIRDTSETDIPTVFTDKEIYGVVTSHPNIARLIKDQNAKLLFDSREIPQEILDMIVVRREVLEAHPEVAQALLASWFSIMDRLQGNKRSSTLDAMARLAGLSREEFEKQLTSVTLNDTSTKALSAIRDRSRLRKTLRHIRYFIERHTLSGEEPFQSWVSFAGRTPGSLHFNAQPLQDFVTPTKAKAKQAKHSTTVTSSEEEKKDNRKTSEKQDNKN